MVIKMKLLHFENYKDFVTTVSNTFESLESGYDDISIIAKYHEAKEILKEMIHIEYDISCIDLESEEFNDYADEYIISIVNIDGENSIWCEKFKRDGKYFEDESTVTYIMDNCSSKVIKHCKTKFVYEVHVVEEDNTDFDNDKNDNDDDNVHGFTISNTDDNGYRSFSYYSSDPLNQTEIHKMITDFGFTFSK